MKTCAERRLRHADQARDAALTPFPATEEGIRRTVMAERDRLREAIIQARRDLWWFIKTYSKEYGEPEDDEIVTRALAIQDDVLGKALAL